MLLRAEPTGSPLRQIGADASDQSLMGLGSALHQEAINCGDALAALTPDVLNAVQQLIIEQETTYQQHASQGPYTSLWDHSSRVASIAHHIATAEGVEATPALLAGLLHDTGKFAHGSYHADDIPEEAHAARFVERILGSTIYARWIPPISQAILATYLEGEATSDIGRVVYDADSLDKLGSMGVAQFFAKQALRQRFLQGDLLIRSSIELTYAHHAPEMLKTDTGRSLARLRAVRTRRYYTELLEEWQEVGLGVFNLIEQDIAGIICVLVVPDACSCGGRIGFASDIRDAVKCRSVVVTYRCSRCPVQKGFSFCLPNIPGLPPKDRNPDIG